MPGVPDVKKRSKVRRLLMTRRWQAESDRAVAREAGCGKNLVAECRRQLIAAGRHPPLAALGAGRRRLPEYRPGGSCRGGMVYGDDGRPVKESAYLMAQLKGEKGDLARELRRRLAAILGKK